MNENRSTEVVPGMAEAIARRMAELHLSPGTLARRAGVTPQGMMPIRKGYRRSYHAKLKHGAARALRWPPDAIDRLIAGEDPAGFEQPPSGAVEAALTADPLLDDDAREAVLAFYRSAVARSNP